MKVVTIPFPSISVSDADVKKWITDNIPDYTQRLQTSEDFEEFDSETGIQKVYLFSAKQRVPPIYRAVAAHYRNRARFAFVPLEAKVNKELTDIFEIETWPTLLVYNPNGHFVYDGKMKLSELIDFVEDYALPEDKKATERVISSKSQTSMNNVINNL